MMREFREFIMKGNAVDMAIGIVLGVAFGAVIGSLVADILLPPVGLLLGGLDFSNLFIRLAGPPVETLAAAKEAGAVTVNYGVFLNRIIDFVIIGLVLFLVVRQINRMRRAAPAPVTTKECPYCFTQVPLKATRCLACTSPLTAEGVR